MLVILLLTLSLTLQSDKCRVLLLEGGGDRGAYHAGAFRALADNLPPQEIQYDIVSGISVGAINGLVLSFFAKGEEKQAADYFDNQWLNLERTDVWSYWPFYKLPFFQEGLVDSSPLRNMITKMVTEHQIKRDFSFGTVDIEKRKFMRFGNADMTSEEDTINLVMSSSAMSGIFPYVKWRNTTFVDGASMKNFDPVGGIQYCLNKGFNQEDIIIDSILLYSKDFQLADNKITNSIDNIITTIDLEMTRFFDGDINEAKDNYPKVNFRHMIHPGLFFKWDLFIWFQKSTMHTMYKQGVEDGKKVIETYYENLKEQTKNGFLSI